MALSPIEDLARELHRAHTENGETGWCPPNAWEGLAELEREQWIAVAERSERYRREALLRILGR